MFNTCVHRNGDRQAAWLGLPASAKRPVRAGVLLGLGLGGFFDGIVFHQILQWHHMLSAWTAPTVVDTLRLNVTADGVFHAAAYAFTVLGIALLQRAWRRPSVPTSGRTLLGSTVLGWGLFNVVGGSINHHLLGLHHVRPGGPGGTLVWDVGFLAWGLLFISGGYAVVRGDDALSRRSDGPRSRPELDSERTTDARGERGDSG